MCGSMKRIGVSHRGTDLRGVGSGAAVKELSDRRILQWDAVVDYSLFAPNGEGSGRGRFGSPRFLSLSVGFVERTYMLADWPVGEVRPLSLAVLGEHYRRYRSPDTEAEAARSLRRWGQLAPVAACVRQGRLELIDGFKRLAAARQIRELSSLSVRAGGGRADGEGGDPGAES